MEKIFKFARVLFQVGDHFLVVLFVTNEVYTKYKKLFRETPPELFARTPLRFSTLPQEINPQSDFENFYHPLKKFTSKSYRNSKMHRTNKDTLRIYIGIDLKPFWRSKIIVKLIKIDFSQFQNFSRVQKLKWESIIFSNCAYIQVYTGVYSEISNPLFIYSAFVRAYI